FSTLRRPTIFTLFPYTTLFRSLSGLVQVFRWLLRITEDSRCQISFREVLQPLLTENLSLTWSRTHLDSSELDNHNWLPLQQSRSDRKSTRLNSSHVAISYAVFC